MGGGRFTIIVPCKQIFISGHYKGLYFVRRKKTPAKMFSVQGMVLNPLKIFFKFFIRD